jgi:hypothetical protein
MSGSSVLRPAPPRILQIGYYGNLLRTRAAMLQRSGYDVVSVLGNDQTKAKAGKLLPGVDLVMVGFSGSYTDRAAITRWFKQEYPAVPVIVLQVSSSERFPEADRVSLSETPDVWLDAIAAFLRDGARGH